MPLAPTPHDNVELTDWKFLPATMAHASTTAPPVPPLPPVPVVPGELPLHAAASKTRNLNDRFNRSPHFPPVGPSYSQHDF